MEFFGVVPTPYVAQTNFVPNKALFYYDGGKPGGELTSALSSNTAAVNFFAQHETIVFNTYFMDAPSRAGAMALFDAIRAARTALGKPRQMFANYINATSINHGQLKAIYRSGTTGVAWFDFGYAPNNSNIGISNGALIRIELAADTGWNGDFTVTTLGTGRNGAVANIGALISVSTAVLGDYAGVTGGNIHVLVAGDYTIAGNWIDSGRPVAEYASSFGTVKFTVGGTPANEPVTANSGNGTKACMCWRDSIGYQPWLGVTQANMRLRRIAIGDRCAQRIGYLHNASFSFSHEIGKAHPTSGLRVGQLLGRAHRTYNFTGAMYDAGHLDAIFLDDFASYAPSGYTAANDGNLDWLGTGTDTLFSANASNVAFRQGAKQFVLDMRDEFPGVKILANMFGQYIAAGNTRDVSIAAPGIRGVVDFALLEGEFFTNYGYGSVTPNGFGPSSINSQWKPTQTKINEVRKTSRMPAHTFHSCQTMTYASGDLTPDRRGVTPLNNQQWEPVKLSLACSLMLGDSAGTISAHWREGYGRAFNPADFIILMDEQKLVFGEPVDGPQNGPRGSPHEPYIFYREFANVLVIANCHPGGKETDAVCADIAARNALPANGTPRSVRVTSTNSWHTNYFGWLDTGISASAYPAIADFGNQRAYPPAGVWKRIISTHGDAANNGEVIGAGGILLTPMRAVFLVRA
jgi:hypothetical protein